MKADPNKANRLRQPSEQTRILIELINAACAGNQSEMQDRLLAILGEDFNDADRIRICARCGRVFWAGRVDMVVCAKCASAWRVAQHRARKGRSNTGGAK
jgi:ribosomal protein S27AE